jgi:hypothetical protein
MPVYPGAFGKQEAKPLTPNKRGERVMKEEKAKLGGSAAGTTEAPSLPAAVDRATFQAELDGLRVRDEGAPLSGPVVMGVRAG